MLVENVTCGNCCGQGFFSYYKLTGEVNELGIGKAECVREKCRACGGTGYLEYVKFTKEEARKIMEVCGLPISF